MRVQQIRVTKLNGESLLEKLAIEADVLIEAQDVGCSIEEFTI